MIKTKTIYSTIILTLLLGLSACGNNAKTADWKTAYKTITSNVNESSPDKKYALIELDDDAYPELVVDDCGYSLSVYGYYNGESVPVALSWGYGAGGNAGYYYIPKSGYLMNTNYDYAGTVRYDNIYEYKDGVLENAIPKDISCWINQDVNLNGMLDEDEISEDYSNQWYYEYIEDGVNKEITEEEYKSYYPVSVDDGELISGVLSFDEINEAIDNY